MILDHTGTEYRGGRIRLSRDWKSNPKQWWEPQTEDIRHYTLTAFVEIGMVVHVLWRGNFFDLGKALRFWEALHDGFGPTPNMWDMPTPGWHPGLLIPGIKYHFATTLTYNSSGTTTWTNTRSSLSVSYFVLAGGGPGGPTNGGGGGSGDLRLGTLTAAGGNHTVTVGAASSYTAVGAVVVGPFNSVFSSITANGGGIGAGAYGTNGGSGGGGTGEVPTNGGTATGVLGHNGGNGANSGATNRCSGGGGGLGTVGSNGNAGTGVGGAGGSGLASSFFGSSVTYGGGGGGGIENGVSNGVGGSGGGGAAGNSGPGDGRPATANTGSGGGGGSRGAGSSGTWNGGAGGSGKVGITFTMPVGKNFNMPNLGM